MNKKFFRFLSVVTLFALGVPSIEGREKISQIEKEFGKEFVQEFQSILKLPAFKSCEEDLQKYFQIDKSYSGKVCLNKDFICDISKFNYCFSLLVTIIDASRYGAKIFSLKLIDDLISYGNDKNNNIFKSESKISEYCTHDGYDYCLKNKYLKYYIKAFECLDGYRNFRSINWLNWLTCDIDNFLANHDKKFDSINTIGKKREREYSFEDYYGSDNKDKITSTSCSTEKKYKIKGRKLFD